MIKEDLMVVTRWIYRVKNELFSVKTRIFFKTVLGNFIITGKKDYQPVP